MYRKAFHRLEYEEHIHFWFGVARIDYANLCHKGLPAVVAARVKQVLYLDPAFFASLRHVEPKMTVRQFMTVNSTSEAILRRVEQFNVCLHDNYTMHRRITCAHRVVSRENGLVGDGEIQRLLRGEFNKLCAQGFDTPIRP